MKVVCITDKVFNYLTKGKTYSIFEVIGDVYYLNNDDNMLGGYNKTNFVSLSDFRNDKIDSIIK